MIHEEYTMKVTRMIYEEVERQIRSWLSIPGHERERLLVERGEELLRENDRLRTELKAQKTSQELLREALKWMASEDEPLAGTFDYWAKQDRQVLAATLQGCILRAREAIVDTAPASVPTPKPEEKKE